MAIEETRPQPPPAHPGGAARRQLALEVLRGVAAMGVLLRHAWSIDGTPLRFTDRGFPELMVAQGASGVWLFFVLSGYLITRPFVVALLDGDRLPRLGTYTARRATRIYPAYFLAFGAIVVLLGGRAISDVWQVPLHFALLQNLVPGEQQAIYNVSWSLSLEILFYALVPVVAFLIRRRTGSRPVAPGNLAMGVLIVWGLSFGWDAWAALMPITRTTIWLRMLLPSMLSMFCPGILLAVIEHAARTDARWARRLSAVRNAKRVLPLAAVLFGLAVIAEPTVDPLIVHELARQAFAICFGLVVAVVATVRVSERPLGRLAMWLGAVSYGVYLWHGALVEIIYKRGIWVPTTGPSLGAYGVRIVYLTALTLPLAWASWKFVEAPLLARVRSGRQWSRLAARG